MVSCMRCCLNNSTKVVNVLEMLCGVGMIIYSLWLLKKWQLGVSDLPSTSNLPEPWFIYTCLGVAIAVCMSSLLGHVVAHFISNSLLCIYIVSICSLLLLEVAVIVTIFFRIDWTVQIAECIDEHHKEFKSFLSFHLRMCRLIVIMILVPQVNVNVLAITLWAIGTVPRTHCSCYLDIPDFNQSFLDGTYSRVPDISRLICRDCEILSIENPGENFLSRMKAIIRMRFSRESEHS